MLKSYLAKLLVYLVLEVAALLGVPMRPDEIEKLMKIHQQPTIQKVDKDSDKV